jgi:hypothetical protein
VSVQVCTRTALELRGTHRARNRHISSKDAAVTIIFSLPCATLEEVTGSENTVKNSPETFDTWQSGVIVAVRRGTMSPLHSSVQVMNIRIFQ